MINSTFSTFDTTYKTGVSCQVDASGSRSEETSTSQISHLKTARESPGSLEDPSPCSKPKLVWYVRSHTLTYTLPLTSPEDVIQRLAPSLAQHVGCTILDINPGIGLWSSKLHDFLKPRRHVLMEPKQDTFLPYLRPLLDAPNSRYVLRDWRDEHQWEPQRYIDDGLIPSPGDLEGQRRPGSPILVIANLADQQAGTKRRADLPKLRGFHSHIKIIDMVHAERMRSAFQAYGPTRFLIWIPDAEKRALIPRTIGSRGKVAVYLESTFHAEEIAGAAPSLSGKRREDHLDAESSKLVAIRMKEERTQIPSERQPKTIDILPVSLTARSWHVEIAALEEGFESHKLSQFVGKPPGPLVPLRRGPRMKQVTPEYERYQLLQNLYKSQNKLLDRLAQILQKQEEIDRLDLAAHREGVDRAEQEHELKVIDSKSKDFKDELDLLRPKELERILFLDDDRRAFNMNPSLLSWDHRRAEPLVVQPEEFYIPKELALLDFQPLPREKQFPVTLEQSLYFDMICTQLFGPRGQTTLKSLNQIAPGAYEALVHKCPAITDPRKGGRRDVESVRVRNLTLEMLWQLAVAWDEWLFKPGMTDTLSHFTASLDPEPEMRRGNMGRN